MLDSVSLLSLTPEQVQTAFELYLKEKGSVLPILIANGRGWEPGTANKYEWLEGQLVPQSWNVNASSLAGAFNTAAAMTFVSTSWMKANQILRFINADGTDVGDMQVKVVSVTNATTAQVIVYGGTTGSALDNTKVAKLVSEAVAENEKAFVGGDEYLPGRNFNYFQILRTQIEMSATAMNGRTFGNVNDIVFQLQSALYRIEQQIQESIIRGRAVQRGSGENGTFGGILSYVTAAGGNVVDAAGAALSPDLINQVLEMIYADGGQVDTIVLGVKQGRKLSAFNKNGVSGANLYTFVDAASKDVGGYAMRFISDIPVAGGMITNIILDDKMPINQVGFCKLSELALVPFSGRDLRVVDATVNGQDGTTALLRGEYTLGARSMKYSGGLLKGLSIA